MLRKIVGLYIKCKRKKDAKNIASELTRTHYEGFLAFNPYNRKGRFGCRNMIRINRILNNLPPFKTGEINRMVGHIIENESVLTTFGNVKEQK